MVDYPVELIRRVCVQKNVDPSFLLAFLLHPLANRHRMAAGFFEGDQRRKLDAIKEIKERLRRTGEKREVPISLLALLDLIAQDERAELDEATKVMEEEGDEEGAQAFDNAIATVDALRIILKDLMNIAEHDGIQTRLDIEEKQSDDEQSED